jgi:hypothetical protein
VTGRQGRRRKQLQGDLKEARGCWKLKWEALGRTVWTTHFRRSYGPLLRLPNEWIVDYVIVNILPALAVFWHVTPCSFVDASI